MREERKREPNLKGVGKNNDKTHISDKSLVDEHNVIHPFKFRIISRLAYFVRFLRYALLRLNNIVSLEHEADGSEEGWLSLIMSHLSAMQTKFDDLRALGPPADHP